ncbi:hypothetical protein QCD79_35115, partial [Pseudomonas quasicaspiana]|nr:hypothetical protein [Pseudomonas quasicaspiana]
YSTDLPTAADDGPSSLRCSNLTFRHTSLRQIAPVSFREKETGAIWRSEVCRKVRLLQRSEEGPSSAAV